MDVGTWSPWMLMAAPAAAVLALLWFWQTVRLWWRRRVGLPCPRVTLLLVTKEQGEGIEGFLRSLLHHTRRATGWRLAEVVVIDENSVDETPAILRRLSRELPPVRFVRWLPVRGREGDRQAQSPLELGSFLATEDLMVVVNLRRDCDLRQTLQAVTSLLAGAETTDGDAAVNQGRTSSAGRIGKMYLT